MALLFARKVVSRAISTLPQKLNLPAPSAMNPRRLISSYVAISGVIAGSLILARLYTGRISGIAVSAHIRDTIRECAVIGFCHPITVPLIVWANREYPLREVQIYSDRVRGRTTRVHVIYDMHAGRLLFPFGWRAPLLMGSHGRTALLYKLGIIRA